MAEALSAWSPKTGSTMVFLISRNSAFSPADVAIQVALGKKHLSKRFGLLREI
jgi:hypothetical protein